MNNIFKQLMSMNNPLQFASQKLSSLNNPMINDALNGNAEQIVRNICKERGLDADKLYQETINMRKF